MANGNTVNAWTYEFNPLKGWPSPAALTHRVELAPEQEFKRGMVLHKDPVNGKGIVGMNGNVMPLYPLRNDDEGDVLAHWVVECLVGCGPFEVQTSQFVGEDFAYNDPVTAGEVGADDAGYVMKATEGFYSEPVVGMVSVKPEPNPYGVSVLAFWMLFIPADPARLASISE